MTHDTTKLFHGIIEAGFEYEWQWNWLKSNRKQSQDNRIDRQTNRFRQIASFHIKLFNRWHDGADRFSAVSRSERAITTILDVMKLSD